MRAGEKRHGHQKHTRFIVIEKIVAALCVEADILDYVCSIVE